MTAVIATLVILLVLPWLGRTLWQAFTPLFWLIKVIFLGFGALLAWMFQPRRSDPDRSSTTTGWLPRS
jgi:hypothetical protein